jgi:formate hydrogenlyase subunit 4
MRDVLHVYGLFVSFGIFAISAFTAVAAFSEGAIYGALGASGSVMAPLSIACFIMAVHCLIRLVKEAR